MNHSSDRFIHRAGHNKWEDTVEIVPRRDSGDPDFASGRSSRRRSSKGLGAFDKLLWTVCIAIIVGVVASNWNSLTGNRGSNHGWIPVHAFGSRPFEGKDVVSILVMGTDDKVEQGRSDTMMVATVNLPQKKTVLLSIPRDSRVQIPGYGVDRINAAYVHGGATLARSAAEELLGRPMDYYMKTDFSGFQKIVDAMGGIEIDVEKRMVYRDHAQNLTINLRPGRHLLKGYDAMGYVRFRHDAMGDIGRIERQQKFMHAVLERMTSPAMLPRLPFLLNSMRDCVKTDIPASDFLTLARLGKGLNQSNLVTEMVPGCPVMVAGKSFWEVDRYETARLLASLDSKLRNGESKPEEQSGPVSVCVLNGCGIPGAATKVAKQLSAAGFQVTRTGNADSFGYASSQIIDSSRNGKHGERVRSAIGCGAILPEGKLSDTESDVTLILGKDFGGV